MDWATIVVNVVAMKLPMATPMTVPATPKNEAMTAAATAPVADARICRRLIFMGRGADRPTGRAYRSGPDQRRPQAPLSLGDGLGPPLPGVPAAVGAEPDLLAECVVDELLGDQPGQRDATDGVRRRRRLERAQPDPGHRQRPFEPADDGVVGAQDATPLRQGVDDRRRGVDDAAGGHVAQAGGDGDAVPDVVVAFEQD